MDIILRQQVPESGVAPSMMFCYPTGLVDIWSPTIEQVLLPKQYNPPMQIEIKVTFGTAEYVHFPSWKQKAYHTMTGVLMGKQTLDYAGRFIFDARFDNYNNIAHIIDNVATRVLFAQQILSDHFKKKIGIHVILESRALKYSLANEVYRLLDIPIISADNDVHGELVTVSHSRIFSVKPQLFNFEFPGYKKTSFEKIFIPRRGSRRLINNDEVIAFLTKQGFQTCYFEDFSITEQWSIARDTKVVVAVHGAAVSNLVFNRLGLEANANPGSGVKVVEIMSPGWIHSGFRDLINAINGSWCAVRGQITPNVLKAVDFSKRSPVPTKSPYKDPFKVDCNTIQMALDYIESV